MIDLFFQGIGFFGVAMVVNYVVSLSFGLIHKI